MFVTPDLQVLLWCISIDEREEVMRDREETTVVSMKHECDMWIALECVEGEVRRIHKLIKAMLFT